MLGNPPWPLMSVRQRRNVPQRFNRPILHVGPWLAPALFRNLVMVADLSVKDNEMLRPVVGQFEICRA